MFSAAELAKKRFQSAMFIKKSKMLSSMEWRSKIIKYEARFGHIYREELAFGLQKPDFEKYIANFILRLCRSNDHPVSNFIHDYHHSLIMMFLSYSPTTANTLNEKSFNQDESSSVVNACTHYGIFGVGIVSNPQNTEKKNGTHQQESSLENCDDRKNLESLVAETFLFVGFVKNIVLSGYPEIESES
eukprot:Sdes_comp19032_c0_seq1m9595